MLNSQTKEDDSHIHPLLRESRQESDRSTELSGTQDKSILHPYANHSSKDLVDSTSPTQQQPNLSSRELKEHKNSASHPDAIIESRDGKEDVSNTNNITELESRPPTENSNKTSQKISFSTQETNSKKQSQKIPQAPLSDSEKLDRDLIRSHHLLYAAMSKSENDLTDPNPVVPSAKAEPKSTSSTFHPLLEEVRHKKFASKTEPLAPPRKITGDLPLRNYRSQESSLSQDFRASRDDDIRTSHKRSSSVYQRGSRQFSSPLASPPKRASVLYSAAEPSAAAPSSHVVILPNRTAIQNDDSAQPAKPDVTASPPAELPAISKDLNQASVESPAAENDKVHLTASKNDTAESEKKGSSSADSQVVNTASAASQESGSTSKLSNEKFKTSATNNAPFYLNPVSSAALLEFLAETPPPSPPNPNKTHNLPPEGTVTSQPVQRDHSSETKPNNTAPPPPPSSWQVPSGPPGPPPSGPPPSIPQTSSGLRPPPVHPPPSGILSMAPGALPPAITRPVVPPPPPGPPPASGLFSVAPGALPPAIARPPPPVTVSNLTSPAQSAAPKKSGGLKKFFGVGSSSNTSSAPKKAKLPKGPLVIGEPQLIVVPTTATKKEKGKAKASKMSKKGGEGERSQHDEINNNNGNRNGNGNEKDNNPDGRFMGVGKDGVWISRQNFVKT